MSLPYVNAALLDTYEREWIGFARSLVATTDRAFTGLIGAGAVGEFTWQILTPFVFGFVTRFKLGRHAIFRTISQTRISLPRCSLSQGSAGDIHGGDRLPWTRSPAQNNFDPLRSLDWQAHVYGKTEGELETACRDLQLPLHSFPWSDRANDAGLKKDALYRVRPDG